MKKIKASQLIHHFRDGGPDDELIGLSNEFARLPENQGIPTTSLLRNFFCRKLKEVLEKSRINMTPPSQAV